MTHNMKAFLELSSQDHRLAAQLQLLMLGENGHCSVATQAAVIRLAAQHGLELHDIDFDYLAPDIYTPGHGSGASACHCFRNGSGISAADGQRACNCIMYGVGRGNIAPVRAGRARRCTCLSAGVGMGV